MESIKNRTFFVNNMVCEGCEEKIKNEILKLNGVMDIMANHKTATVKIKYGLSKINVKNIEKKLKEIGYNLKGDFLFKLKMGFLHFLEENEKDNLTGKTSTCCSDPKEILEKAGKGI